MCGALPLLVKTPQESKLLQASRWIKHPVLLDISEMEDLFQVLSPFYIAIVSAPVTPESAFLKPTTFLDLYREYVLALQRGIVPDEMGCKAAFSSAITTSLDTLYAIQVGTRYLIKPKEPILQLQRHHFFYSPTDHRIHSMVFSETSVTWGIQFSYPQLFQDHDTGEIRKGTTCRNAPLFLQLSKWMRRHTQPTPFKVQGKRIYATLRMGKKVLPWIASHQGLPSGLEVDASRNCYDRS